MKCVLCVPRVRGISTRAAFAPQLPLGHVMVGSNLIRGGHDVTFLDADVLGLTLAATVRRIAASRPDCLLLGHPASTVGHPAAMRLATAVRRRLPGLPIIYGGPHPTYHAAVVLASGQVDYVVTHEAERVTRELVDRLAVSAAAAADTPGVARPGRPVPEPATVAADLDAIRPLWNGPWHLNRYRAYGRRSAVVQFSRGCPRKCSYCGQWDFWKKWRHRSVGSFVQDVDTLSRQGVRLFWIADENWSPDRDLFYKLLDGLASVNREHHLIVAMEAQHVVRDADHLSLYRRAGVTRIMLGVDGQDDDLLGANPKRLADRMPEVIERVRAAGMTTIVNHFMPATGTGLPADLDRVRACRADFYNTLHPTPHAWTAYGRRAAGQVVNPDLRTWDYRHPVIGTGPGELLVKRWRAKQVEAWLYWAAFGRRSTGRLALRSTALAALVFVRELAGLLVATFAFAARGMCPKRRRVAVKPAVRDRLTVLAS